MEYKEIIDLLENAQNQATKFRTKNWVEIKHDSRGTHTTNSQIKFRTSMIKSSLCDYSDAYILLSGIISVKFPSNFWKSLEMSLISCEISLILTWSKNCIIASNTAANQEVTFA